MYGIYRQYPDRMVKWVNLLLLPAFTVMIGMWAL